MTKLASIVAFGFFFLCASSAFADDRQVVTSRFRSYDGGDVAKATCELAAIADVGGHERLFDVSFEGWPCSSTSRGNAIPLRVRVEPLPNGLRDVILESEIPEDADERELRASLDAVAIDLLGRIGQRRVTAPAHEEDKEAEEPAKKKPDYPVTRGGSIALMAVGAAGLGIAAVVVSVAAIDGAGHGFGCSNGLGCGSKDFSGYAVGAGISAGVGLAFLIAGGIFLSYAPPKSAVSMHFGPTGGSLRVAF